MSTPPIPHAMVEAAARALHEHDRLDVLSEPPWEQLTDDERESYRTVQREALTAALDLCEVREYRRAVVKQDDGSTYTYPWAVTDRQGSQRRLAITTPAEPVDTEGAAT